MRNLWAIVIISGIAGLSPAPQSAWADETEQPRQLGVTVGMQSFTTRYKISLDTDEKLKPGDHVTLYYMAHVKEYIPGRPLTQDVWVSDVVAENLRVIAIDRTETPVPNQPYVLRMVRLEINPRDRIEHIRAGTILAAPLRVPGAKSSTAERTIGLTGDYPPNICGDCIILSWADYNAKYRPQCSIKTRRGAHVMKVIIPCPNK